MATRILATAAIAGLALLNGHWTNILFISVAGFFAFGAQTVLNNLTASFYDTEVKSTGVGMELGVGRLGGILGPYIVGWLKELFPGSMPMFAAMALTVAVSALAIFLRCCASRTVAQPSPAGPATDHPSSACPSPWAAIAGRSWPGRGRGAHRRRRSGVLLRARRSSSAPSAWEFDDAELSLSFTTRACCAATTPMWACRWYLQAFRRPSRRKDRIQTCGSARACARPAGVALTAWSGPGP